MQPTNHKRFAILAMLVLMGAIFAPLATARSRTRPTVIEPPPDEEPADEPCGISR